MTSSFASPQIKLGIVLEEKLTVLEEGTSPPLDLDPNETIEADAETLPFAEEFWKKNPRS